MQQSQGYAAVDGLNEAGLAVNGLYDSHVNYGPTDGKGHFLSANRWVQFVLDRFANVQQAIQYFATRNITIVSELLPDTSDTQSHLHLALSDAEGNSGVIEVRNGRFDLYESRHDTVVTNQPDYETQRMLTAYWQYIWGQRPNVPVEHPVTPHQVAIVRHNALSAPVITLPLLNPPKNDVKRCIKRNHWWPLAQCLYTLIRITQRKPPTRFGRTLPITTRRFTPCPTP